MITEWLIGVGTGIAAFIGTLFEQVQIPEWVTSSMDGISSFVNSAAGLGVWMPWEVLSVVLAVLIAVFGVTFGAKLLRAAASYIPFFGGAG